MSTDRRKVSYTYMHEYIGYTELSPSVRFIYRFVSNTSSVYIKAAKDLVLSTPVSHPGVCEEFFRRYVDVTLQGTTPQESSLMGFHFFFKELDEQDQSFP